MRKLLIGFTFITVAAILVKRIIGSNYIVSESERADETCCPYLIEPEKGGKHRVYFSS